MLPGEILAEKGPAPKEGGAVFRISAWSLHERSMGLAGGESRGQSLGYSVG